MKYLIGDIHGELGKLKKLLRIIKNDATEYIFLGDYMDKGKNTKSTIDTLLLLAKEKKCVFLMGDHEYAWLQCLKGRKKYLGFLLKYGGIRTLESYLDRPLTEKVATSFLKNKKELKRIFSIHADFLKSLKTYHLLDSKFLCIHAGINPKNKNLPLGLHSVEEMIFIRNAFLNSKFLYKGRRVIFGHTAFKKPYVDRYKIGIDMGATYREKGYGNLIALNLLRNECITHSGKKIKLKCLTKN